MPTSPRSMFPAELETLTALRFFAATFVVFHHAEVARQWLEDGEHAHTARFFQNGYMGVTLFFVLSGFVLHYSRRRKDEDRLGLREFYVGRIARIVPLVYVLSVPYLVTDLADGSFDTWRFFLFLQAWSGDFSVAFGNLAVAWSLSVEMFLYACFPLFYLLIRRVGNDSLGVGIAFVATGLLIPTLGSLYYEFVYDGSLAPADRVVPYSPHHILYRLPAMRLGDFLLGMGLAQVFMTAPSLRSRPRLGIGLVAVGGISLVVLMARIGPEGPWTFDTIWLPSVTMLILGLALVDARVEQRGPLWRLLVLLGKASFAMYLVHEAYVLPAFEEGLTDDQGIVLALPSLAWAFVILAALSWGLHVGIEVPAQRIVRRFLLPTSSTRRPTSPSTSGVPVAGGRPGSGVSETTG